MYVHIICIYSSVASRVIPETWQENYVGLVDALLATRCVCIYIHAYITIQVLIVRIHMHVYFPEMLYDILLLTVLV